MICNMRRGVFMLWLFIASALSAQNISVSSFKLLESDLTANTTGTMERDLNGEVAALIKVVTTEQGFVFDGGMTGIVKTKQEIGEVWVYVPHGMKKVTIKHAQLGVLRDYYFPIPVEKAKTYEMVLTTGKVETIVTHSVNKQFVVFNVKPTNAVVELDDEMLTVDSEGYATKGVAYGTYSYRVSCANYHTEAGQVTVNADGKAELNVMLKPNFGWIKFAAGSELSGADVYIDNERAGKLPFVSENLKSGVHRIKIVKNMYKTYEREVTVQDEETTELDVEMIPNFATVTLTTDDDSEIWIDGEKRNKGRWIGALELGSYTVEVKRESHRTVSEVLRIDSIGEHTYELKAPTPIYATMEISSTPLRALVLIDGVEVGETPLIKNDVLVGTRHMTFKKEGYKTVEKTIVLNENSSNSVSAELNKLHEVAADNNSLAKVSPQSMSAPKNVPTQSKKNSHKKKIEWGYAVGADAGYSFYGFNYGAEMEVMMNRFSLYAGVKNHMVGKYEYYEYNDMHIIQLFRFNTKFGYTLGKNFQFTPQVGVVYGPSILTGKEYILKEIDLGKLVGFKQIDYNTMNRNIMRFAKMRCGLVVGAQLGYRFDFGLGFHITPEYVIGEGVAVNAGVTMKF